MKNTIKKIEQKSSLCPLCQNSEKIYSIGKTNGVLSFPAPQYGIACVHDKHQEYLFSLKFCPLCG